MSKITHTLISMVIIVSSAFVVTLSFAPSVSAATCGDRTFLNLPAWYRGLTDDQCNIKNPSEDKSDDGSFGKFVWRIVLNIIEAFMMIVGYASVAMIIVGGFFYMTATGQPDKIKSAKNTILNAVIGLIIAVSAVAIVNIVVNIF